MRTLLLLVGLLLCGCAKDAATPPTAGPSGPTSGYYTVVFDLASSGAVASDVTAAHVGDERALDVAAVDATHLSMTVQGHASAGPVDLVLTTAGGERVLKAAFTYKAPADPRFAVVVALGASLTQGVQRGVPSFHGTLMGPAAQIARQLGAYFPLPLVVKDLFPGIEPKDIAAPPDCLAPDVEKLVADQSSSVFPKLQDPETNKLSYAAARVDPDIDVHDLAVGGARIADVLRGPKADNLAGNFVSHLVYDPFGEFLSPVTESQIVRLEALKPTLIISTDLFANDVVGGILDSDTIDLAKATPEDALFADIAAAVARLAATKAEVFLANCPRPSTLPATADKRHRMISAGQAAADVDASIASIDALGVKANDVLATEAAKFPNVHIVDLYGGAQLMAQAGVDVGGVHLTSGKLGGLLGLDGVHFTDTGYALLANLFVVAINGALGTSVPQIDLSVVFATDEESPAKLEAAGLHPSECQ